MGFFVVALVLTALTTSAFAQGGGNITGTVKDKSGNPIIGAAVTIPNTARGTSTDIDGRYTIKASAKESLNFSYIGYQSQLIQINNRTTIDVVLTEDNRYPARISPTASAPTRTCRVRCRVPSPA